MKLDDRIRSLSMPLPEDILKRKWGGDLEGAIRAIDLRLETELPDLLRQRAKGEEFSVELIGLCTDICVVSNALVLKANFPEAPIGVDSSCCAGVTPDSHQAALTTMGLCQIDVR